MLQQTHTHTRTHTYIHTYTQYTHTHTHTHTGVPIEPYEINVEESGQLSSSSSSLPSVPIPDDLKLIIARSRLETSCARSFDGIARELLRQHGYEVCLYVCVLCVCMSSYHVPCVIYTSFINVCVCVCMRVSCVCYYMCGVLINIDFWASCHTHTRTYTYIYTCIKKAMSAVLASKFPLGPSKPKKIELEQQLKQQEQQQQQQLPISSEGLISKAPLHGTVQVRIPNAQRFSIDINHDKVVRLLKQALGIRLYSALYVVSLSVWFRLLLLLLTAFFYIVYYDLTLSITCVHVFQQKTKLLGDVVLFPRGLVISKDYVVVDLPLSIIKTLTKLHSTPPSPQTHTPTQTQSVTHPHIHTHTHTHRQSE